MDQLTASSIINKSRISFGTSGARGLVAEFTPNACAAFTLAFIDVMQRTFQFNRIAIGVDLRPSSPAMAAACIAAAKSIGLEVDYCGVIPTPALASYSMANKIPAIVVTGSHIPFDRNGLKFYRPDGEISKDDEIAIMSSQISVPDSLDVLPLPEVLDSAVEAYKTRYLEFFDQNILAGLRIGLYEHSSAARDVFLELLQGLGAEAVSLGRTDEFVPIDTEAVSVEDQQRGLHWSAEHQFDCIISTDGDGDRPLVSDENGVWLRGDILGLLCAQYLGVDALATPVSCNSSVEESGVFTEVVRTRIGSPYVIAGMSELSHFDKVAGFEANGGFLLGSSIKKGSKELSALPTRDAVLPALALLAESKRQEKTVSELVSALPQRFTASDRLKDFPTEKSRDLIAKFASNPSVLLSRIGLADIGISSVNETDGLRLTLTTKQVIHLRPSGNAPELRCYCEAETAEAANKLVKSVLSCLCEM